MFSYRLFTFFCILFVTSEMTLGQSDKKCAEFNEYCQNHWDCCSNSCMSYNYRCTHGYNVNPLPNQEASNKPIMTLEDILDMNFGQGNIVKSNEVSKSERNNDDTATEIKIILQNPDGTPEGTSTQDKNTLQFTTRIGEKDIEGIEKTVTTESHLITTESTESTKDEPCKEIGDKCYTNDECCSKLCHGFLHKCVT